ncbi:MAG TPA: response regulator, partial [Gemmataceae bacterium]|nr:response regulator [Gemmataceae bacterium]
MNAKAVPSVLVIEDDGLAREALVTILSRVGYAAFEAENGQAALERLRTTIRPPDLILLDLMMPVMDGWQFHRALTREPAWAAIPVVICTGAGDGLLHAETLGAAGCIDKPIDPGELFDLLRHLLGEGR